METSRKTKRAMRPPSGAMQPHRGATKADEDVPESRMDHAQESEAHNQGNGPRLMDLHCAAKYMGRSVWGMRRLAYARKIRIVKEPGGRKLYFDRLDLDAFISENKGLYA